MMRRAFRDMFFVALTAAIVYPANADTLTFEGISEPPENSPTGVLRPTRGMSMVQVEQRFGEPEQRWPAVGEPPISRWTYPRYTVYFEHDRVLNAVVKRNIRNP